ncbi:T9SS type A sorting domain-containing protein [bacterium]|nr:T9SS type A sorting domain-containing protein [bacterium]
MKTVTIFLTLIFSLSAQAVILNVPDDFETIQGAINATEDGDTILVAPGEYIENINFVGKAIFVASLIIADGDEVYIDSTVINGNREGSVVTFANGEDQNSVLFGFTITNGTGFLIQRNYSYYYGGGIFCFESNPFIWNCIIRDNSLPDGDRDDSRGGGICCWDASPLIENCVITNNYACNDGGGLYSYSDSRPILISTAIKNNVSGFEGGGISGIRCTIIDCKIGGNRARSGGGIYGGGHNINDSEISFNSAERSGGGLFLQGPSIIRNSIIMENSANRGGGIHFQQSNAILDSCMIKGNSSESGGGGVNIIGWESPTFTYCTISGNSSERGSGAVYCRVNAQPIFEHCTIHNNSSGSEGAIQCRDSNITLSNCTIAGNNAEYCTGIGLRHASQAIIINSILWNDNINIWLSDEASITISYSCIEGGEEGIDTDEDNVQWDEGNIDRYPLFVNSEEGDFHLTRESPCIDTGYPDSPEDPDGTRADMGAFYFDQEVSINAEFIEFPSGIRLYSIYPNPFNSTLQIKYAVPFITNLSFILYDISGRSVLNEKVGYKTPGLHTLEFQAGNLPSGLYILQMKTDGNCFNRKISLLK